MINFLDVKNRNELRQWLITNHSFAKECWVVVKRGRPVDDGTFWYIDAVEEALCFGWIDSTTKKLDSGVTAQRLAPRRNTLPYGKHFKHSQRCTSMSG